MKVHPDEIVIQGYPHQLYSDKIEDVETMKQRAQAYYQQMIHRRTVRDFSSKSVPKSVVELLILTAASAPSGAHKQPWFFCAVSDSDMKAQIRVAAEAEERENYQSRMRDEWKSDLLALGTNAEKPFLTEAPWLLVVFKQIYGIQNTGEKDYHYYVNESVGIACGFLLAAIHQAGLVAVTHTPSPMNFLSQLLQRPDNERPFLLIPIGYPAEPCYVPKLQRKSLDQVALFYESNHEEKS